MSGKQSRVQSCDRSTYEEVPISSGAMCTRWRIVRGVAIGVALTASIGFVSCGGAPGPVAVRIGDVSIPSATVRHWAHAISLGNAIGTSVGRAHGTPRERALDFLISSAWLTSEADERGIAAPDSTIEHHLQERIESVPNGRSEFAEELASTGQTVSDVKLEINAELAATVLRKLVLRQTPPVTASEIADYYTHNRQRFRIPDIRITDLIENIDTRTAAIALGRRIGPGRRFASKALHEHVPRESPSEAAQQGNAELVRAIFAATPGEVAGPARFNGRWVLIVVRRVVPGRFRRPAEVRDEIAKDLTKQRDQQAISEFAKAFRSKWTARTYCRPGFVVQKCVQYHGIVQPEDDRF